MFVALLIVVVVAVVVIGIGIGVRFALRRGHSASATDGAIDPFTIGEPWRRHIATAQSAQRRYRELATTTPAGPTHDRLDEIGGQVRHAVEECWAIAKRGDELDDALQHLDTTSLRNQLRRAPDDASRTSLQSQLDSATRIRATRDDTDARLRLLNVRLGELVAQTAEVSVGVDTTEQLGAGVDDVVTRLQALRLALADINSTEPGPGTTSPPA